MQNEMTSLLFGTAFGLIAGVWGASWYWAKRWSDQYSQRWNAERQLQEASLQIAQLLAQQGDNGLTNHRLTMWD